MEVANLRKGKIYNQHDLISVFGGSFLRVRGITPINSLNVIILVSFHTGRARYEDRISENGIIVYTGEGQTGDQKLTGRNKSIYTAKENGKSLLLFVVRSPSQYTYYGEVELVDEPYFENEIGFDGQMRKAIKFNLMQKTQIRNMTEYEMSRAIIGGVVPMEKPTIQVVGAAIINDKNEVLCAQRGHGSLIGKWEFPGGKIEEGETDQEALKREIKEELSIDIEVLDYVDENYNEYKDNNVNLKVYRCKHISGEINDKEHKSWKWVQGRKLSDLNWADADIPIVETLVDTMPRSIDGQIDFDYLEAEAVKPSNRELLRAVQDYEKSQRNQRKSGEAAEGAVINFEKDKLNNLGRPDLADMVRQVSKKSSDYGYDVLSFDVENGVATESHIEVKSAKLSGSYIEFFISSNELDKFKNDPVYKIYCLIRIGRDYKLHQIKKADFFAHDYLTPMSYRVKIRIAQ